jgi:hypothetical protein
MTDHSRERDHDTLPLPFLYVTKRPNPEAPPDGAEPASMLTAASDRHADLCFEEDVELDPVCTLEFVLHSRQLEERGNGSDDQA